MHMSKYMSIQELCTLTKVGDKFPSIGYQAEDAVDSEEEQLRIVGLVALEEAERAYERSNI